MKVGSRHEGDAQPLKTQPDFDGLRASGDRRKRIADEHDGDGKQHRAERSRGAIMQIKRQAIHQQRQGGDDNRRREDLI